MCLNSSQPCTLVQYSRNENNKQSRTTTKPLGYLMKNLTKAILGKQEGYCSMGIPVRSRHYPHIPLTIWCSPSWGEAALEQGSTTIMRLESPIRSANPQTRPQTPNNRKHHPTTPNSPKRPQTPHNDHKHYKMNTHWEGWHLRSNQPRG